MAASSRQVYIAVIGTGGVGTAFLVQLEALAHRYLSHKTAPTTISLVFVSRSSKCLISESYKGLSFQSWQSDLEKSTTKPLAPPELADFLAKAPGSAILVDNTSSQPLSESYPLFLERGISVVTPNKKAFSSDIALWDSIFSAAANGNGDVKNAGYIFHESTVGAGLPVLSTLKELLETGDIVTRIEGVFSGTMSFLFNSFMPVGGGGGLFSAEVQKAKELGYTEPDPRDDLNGLDVARKLTILARMVGLKVASPTSFKVQSLIPDALEGVASSDEFLSKLPDYDKQIDGHKRAAANEGKVLRYVGSIDVTKDEVEVGLKSFDTSHPIAALKGSDNIINFYTKRYGSNPLIIQGAGAGGEVTAMGVTGDLIKVFRVLH